MLSFTTWQHNELHSPVGSVLYKNDFISCQRANLQFAGGLVHLVEAQVHHDGRQGLLGLLPHVSVAVLQTGIEGGHAELQVRGHEAQGGQTLCQPAEDLGVEEEKWCS